MTLVIPTATEAPAQYVLVKVVTPDLSSTVQTVSRSEVIEH